MRVPTPIIRDVTHLGNKKEYIDGTPLKNVIIPFIE